MGKKSVEGEAQADEPKAARVRVKAADVPLKKNDTLYIVSAEGVRARRDGTKAGDRFALIQDGMTVAEWLAASKDLGGSLRHLRKDVVQGRLRIEEGPEEVKDEPSAEAEAA
jgi:hypothetical protein